MAMRLQTEWAHASGLFSSIAALLLMGCAGHSESSGSIRSASEVRIYAATSASEDEWSSTYGKARPKLQEVVSLGTIDLPAASSGAGPSGTSTPSVVVQVENHTTQSNVVVVPAGYYRPAQVKATRKHPRHTSIAKTDQRSTKTQHPSSPSADKKRHTARKKTQPTTAAPLALIGSVSP